MPESGYFFIERRFSEGDVDYFRYIKNVTLEDHNKYMIFEDKYGIRHFVLFEYYEKHLLTPSEMIRCYIDKINCTGRIILEPEHPVYKRGEVYDFRVLSVKSNHESLIVSVSDCYGNIIEVNSDPEAELKNGIPGAILARVKKTKHGIPEIELV